MPRVSEGVLVFSKKVNKYQGGAGLPRGSGPPNGEPKDFELCQQLLQKDRDTHLFAQKRKKGSELTIATPQRRNTGPKEAELSAEEWDKFEQDVADAFERMP